MLGMLKVVLSVRLEPVEFNIGIGGLFWEVCRGTGAGWGWTGVWFGLIQVFELISSSCLEFVEFNIGIGGLFWEVCRGAGVGWVWTGVWVGLIQVFELISSSRLEFVVRKVWELPQRKARNDSCTTQTPLVFSNVEGNFCRFFLGRYFPSTMRSLLTWTVQQHMKLGIFNLLCWTTLRLRRGRSRLLSKLGLEPVTSQFLV